MTPAATQPSSGTRRRPAEGHGLIVFASVLPLVLGCFNLIDGIPRSPAGQYLDGWARAIIAAGSYPRRVKGMYNLGGGPHFGSGLTVCTAAELYGKGA